MNILCSPCVLRSLVHHRVWMLFTGPPQVRTWGQVPPHSRGSSP